MCTWSILLILSDLKWCMHLSNSLFLDSIYDKSTTRWPLKSSLTEVLWSIWGSHQTLWSLPLPNVTWHSGTWPYTMTPSIDKTLHQFANLLPNWTLIPILTLLPSFGGFHRTLQRVRLANRGRLLLRTPGPVPFGTCISSSVETILSWTCHVYGPFEFRTSLGTSSLPFNFHITNLSFLSSNIPSSPDNGVFICQLTWYARASSSY